MPRYEYPQLNILTNGTRLTIWGVEHTPEFFEKHRSRFERIVEAHPALVLEQPIGGHFYDNSFFGALGDLAHQQGKKVYVVDPHQAANYILESVTFYLGGISLGKGLKNSKQTSRRDFIRKSLQVAAGSSLVAGNLFVQLAMDYLDRDRLIDYGVDDLLGYGVIDYRNLVIADGLERLCRESKIKKIVSIHGAAHSQTVYKYLKDPKLRFKRLAYVPHDLLANTKIREYIPAGEEWVLTREF